MRTQLLLVCGALFFSVTAGGAEPNTVPGSVSAEAQTRLAGMRTGQLPPGGDMSDPVMLNRMRKALGNMFVRQARAIDPDYFLTEQDMNGVTGYWVNTKRPAKTDNVIIYLHGGGFILGSAQQNVASALRVSAAAGVPVISVEYRLAPEHPFPAALDDALAAYQWLLDIGYDGKDIAFYGDSAGGALSLALGLRIRDLKLPAPAAVAALSPSGDRTGDGDTRITLANVDPVLRMDPRPNYRLYVGDADPKDPLVSPVYADYTNYPPLLIQTGTREVLLSDSVRIARKARDDGAESVQLDIREGMWHGWHDTPGLPEADASCADLAAFFNEQFARHDGWF